MKLKSARMCCVSSCQSVDDGSVVFHQFPKPGIKVVLRHLTNQKFYCDARKVWEDRVGADQRINKYSKVCSLHFTQDDYTNSTRSKLSRRRLKTSAIPSLNLPHEICSGFKKFEQKPSMISTSKQETTKVVPERDKLAFSALSAKSAMIVNSSESGQRRLSAEDIKILEYEHTTEEEKEKLEELLDILLMYTSYEFEKLKSALITNCCNTGN